MPNGFVGREKFVFIIYCGNSCSYKYRRNTCSQNICRNTSSCIVCGDQHYHNFSWNNVEISIPTIFWEQLFLQNLGETVVPTMFVGTLVPTSLVGTAILIKLLEQTNIYNFAYRTCPEGLYEYGKS